ncbi:MAG: carboxypeptidase regulatory-like domain-containing protein [Elusimicrobia bacterium]|nr:carboxypeptidase regulatory-like domain-containing protein [Elusimicrobiota bacterium]
MKRLQSSRGVSLVELVVAMTIMTVIAIAGMSSFSYITKAIHTSRTRTLANNLIQEKMEVMKNYSYFQMLVTTHTAVNSTHGVEYDDVTYVPETVSMWGYPVFTRATHVAYAEMAGTQITTVSYASVDTGLKQITVYLMWEDGHNNKMLTIKNLLANPAATGMDSGIRGTVNKAVGGALTGAVVEVVGNPNWTAVSDSAGAYTFTVSRGTYSVIASSTGYYQQIRTNISAPRGGFGTADFTAGNAMVAIATGAFKTSVWMSTSIVISQVVAGTGAYIDDPGSDDAGYRTLHDVATLAAPLPLNERDVEYVELYNPTTFTWTLDSTNFQILYGNQDWSVPKTIPLAFTNNTLRPNHYFLIASTTPISIHGSTRTADAVYGTNAQFIANGFDNWTYDYRNVIKEYVDIPPAQCAWCQTAQPGGIGIKYNGVYVDRVAWRTGGLTAPEALTERTVGCQPTYADGLKDGDAIVRMTEPNDYKAAYGPAYDTDNNASNFRYMVAMLDDYSLPVYANASDGTTVYPNAYDWKRPVAGKPAHGAIAAAPDGYSLASQAYPVSPDTGNERADIFIEGVTTGTWTITVSSGAYMLQIGTVAITQGATYYIPDASTVSSWTASGYYNTRLTSASTGGFVQGYVYGADTAYWTPLNDLLVWASGVTGRTNSNGFYLLNTTSGTVTVTANYSTDNASYSPDSQSTTLSIGEVQTIPAFHLAQSGVIMGYVTTGTGALPNVVAKAVRTGAAYESYSDPSGYFYIRASTSAFTYTVTPVLASGQAYTSSPSPMTASLASTGSNVFVGTVTVSGGMGRITGSVKSDALCSTNANCVITTGVLLLASKGTISDPPPAISGVTAPGLADPIFSVSSQSDGTYNLEVTAGSYYMAAYYPLADPYSGSLSFQRKDKTPAQVSVTAGATTANIDFSGTWP